MDFYMPEIGGMLTKYENGRCFDLNKAAWLGFTYRHLYIETKVPSAQLIKIYPFDLHYEGLHTIDADNAAEILINNHHDEIWDEKRLQKMGFYESRKFNTLTLFLPLKTRTAAMR